MKPLVDGGSLLLAALYPRGRLSDLRLAMASSAAALTLSFELQLFLFLLDATTALLLVATGGGIGGAAEGLDVWVDTGGGIELIVAVVCADTSED